MSYPSNFLLWDVRPAWFVMPSPKWGSPTDFGVTDETSAQFMVYGVGRASKSITRELEPLNAIEEYNLEWIEKPSRFSFSIFVREASSSFEFMRRISAAGVYFRVEYSALGSFQQSANKLIPQENNNTSSSISTLTRELKGIEYYDGCRVVGENVNYEVAQFPLREFRCVALRYGIGGGKFRMLWGDREAENVTYDGIEEGNGIINGRLVKL